MARQMLDMTSPTNFVATNPVLEKRISDTGGQCLVDGLRHLMHLAKQHGGSWWLAWKDWLDENSGTPVAPPGPSAAFPPIAAAPGRDVMEH